MSPDAFLRPHLTAGSSTRMLALSRMALGVSVESSSIAVAESAPGLVSSLRPMSRRPS